jgi:hypothetical protein
VSADIGPGRHDRRHELLEAAIEAEQQTGRREETEAEAERHILLRIARVTLGVIVVGVGLSLLVLPGPGLVVIAAGLALMAPDVPFARRWLHAVRRRIPEDEDGSVAAWVIAVSTGCLLVSVGGSLWWTFLR